jgi:hypothetical protein
MRAQTIRGRSGVPGCPVSQLIAMDDVDAAVLEALREDVLRPEVLSQAVELALDQLEAGPSRAQLAHLEEQTAALEASRPSAPVSATPSQPAVQWTPCWRC